MAKKTGLSQQFYHDGHDLSGDVGSIDSCSSPRGVLVVPGLNSSSVERILGLSDGQLSYTPWFNDAANQAHAALSNLPTTDVIDLWCLGGSIGDVAAALVAKQTNYDPTREQDGSLRFSIDSMSNGVALEWMELLTAGKVTQASSGATTSRNDSSSSSAGLAAVLQVVDIDSGTPTVVLQESSDDGSGDAWATLISFAAVADGNEPTAERKTVSGTVEQYLRLNVTGTFTNLDFVVATRRGLSGDDVAY